ncbi:MAG: ABC transporter ATP-binding protein, partial [Acidimicrobiales bacterium]
MSREAPAIETVGLAKAYGSTWGLQDCSIDVPEGRISALVGPNGAGKTTLLRLLMGLRRPTSGEARVLGRAPAQDEDFLASVGFLAQEIPLYRQLCAAEHLRIGAHLNRRWDVAAAEQRLAALRVPLDRPVHTLSGGQRAQVALSLALAKRPRVLLLDEPLAALDPLARREFLTSLADVTIEGDVTVVLSSHLVHDLERVCNHLILLTASRVRLCGDIDDVLGGHRELVGPRRSSAELERLFTVVRATQTERQSRVLARLDGPVLDPAWEVSEVGLEDIILAYMSEDEALAAGALS